MMSKNFLPINHLQGQFMNCPYMLYTEINLWDFSDNTCQRMKISYNYYPQIYFPKYPFDTKWQPIIIYWTCSVQLSISHSDRKGGLGISVALLLKYLT